MTKLAWHFVGKTLRNSSKIPKVGEKLVVAPPLVLCAHGLHASYRLLDALKYAPGFNVCRVQISGEIIESDDKLVCSERTIIWKFDAKDILVRFAKDCALDVIDLWDCPESVKTFLESGIDSSEAARAAAEAARAATWAAEAAAWAAAEAAGAPAEAAARAAWAVWIAAWAAARAAWAARAATKTEIFNNYNEKLEKMLFNEAKRLGFNISET
jgi:hypothetical protein